MILQPLPKSLLPHVVLYCEKMTGRYEGSFKDPVKITNVRVDYSFTVKKVNHEKEMLIKAYMYIDCVNSSPAIEMTTDSKVLYDNKELIVLNVKPILAAHSIHHYEVELV